MTLKRQMQALVLEFVTIAQNSTPFAGFANARQRHLMVHWTNNLDSLSEVIENPNVLWWIGFAHVVPQAIHLHIHLSI